MCLTRPFRCQSNTFSLQTHQIQQLSQCPEASHYDVCPLGSVSGSDEQIILNSPVGAWRWMLGGGGGGGAGRGTLWMLLSHWEGVFGR